MSINKFFSEYPLKLRIDSSSCPVGLQIEFNHNWIKRSFYQALFHHEGIYELKGLPQDDTIATFFTQFLPKNLISDGNDTNCLAHLGPTGGVLHPFNYSVYNDLKIVKFQ